MKLIVNMLELFLLYITLQFNLYNGYTFVNICKF